MISVSNKEVESSAEAEKEVISVSNIPEVPAEEAPVKPKPKRRRELDALQEDLRTSWICAGAMQATGSRPCSQKNKSQEPTHEPTAIEDESKTTG